MHIATKIELRSVPRLHKHKQIQIQNMAKFAAGVSMVPFLRFLGQCVNFFHTFEGKPSTIQQKERGKKLTVDNFPTVAKVIDPTESELHETHLLFRDQKWHCATSTYEQANI
jgi:hypothetical protein